MRLGVKTGELAVWIQRVRIPTGSRHAQEHWWNQMQLQQSERTEVQSRAEVPGQSTHFPRKSHTTPPICWGAAVTEGSGSGGALPPGRGLGRGRDWWGLVSQNRKMETKKKHLNKGNGSRNDEGTKRRRTDTDRHRHRHGGSWWEKNKNRAFIKQLTN